MENEFADFMIDLYTAIRDGRQVKIILFGEKENTVLKPNKNLSPAALCVPFFDATWIGEMQPKEADPSWKKELGKSEMKKTRFYLFEGDKGPIEVAIQAKPYI